MVVQGKIGSLINMRTQVRYAVSGPIPGKLFKGSGQVMDVIYVDVSQKGLGVFVSDSSLKIGDRLVLMLEGREPISVSVCWTRMMTEKAEGVLDEYLRAGLSVESVSIDLLSAFRAFSSVE